MLPDRVSNPGPLTYESGALPVALRGPAPFLNKVCQKRFPEGLFHLDSAPSHTYKETIRYLDYRKVNFIKREESMPKSPDAAPIDFGIWGIFSRGLQK